MTRRELLPCALAYILTVIAYYIVIALPFIYCTAKHLPFDAMLWLAYVPLFAGLIPVAAALRLAETVNPRPVIKPVTAGNRRDLLAVIGVCLVSLVMGFAVLANQDAKIADEVITFAGKIGGLAVITALVAYKIPVRWLAKGKVANG